MQQNGYKTAAELSRATGVSQSQIGHYLKLTNPPVQKKGGFKTSILKISKVLKVVPEILFPPQHLEKCLKKNEVSVEIDMNDVHDLIEQNSTQKFLDTQEMEEQMYLALSKLKPREKAILEARYGLEDGEEKTLEVCGNIFGISRDRVRQIQECALRKLRHPDCCKNLKDFKMDF